MNATTLPFDIILEIYSHLSIDHITSIYRVNKLFYKCFNVYVSRHEDDVLIYKKDLEDLQIFRIMHPKLSKTLKCITSIESYRKYIGKTKKEIRTALCYGKNKNKSKKKHTPCYNVRYIDTTSDTFKFTIDENFRIRWQAIHIGNNELWWLNSYLPKYLFDIPNPFNRFPLIDEFLYTSWLLKLYRGIEYPDNINHFLRHSNTIPIPPTHVDKYEYGPKIKEFLDVINDINGPKKKRKLNELSEEKIDECIRKFRKIIS